MHLTGCARCGGVESNFHFQASCVINYGIGGGAAVAVSGKATRSLRCSATQMQRTFSSQLSLRGAAPLGQTRRRSAGGWGRVALRTRALLFTHWSWKSSENRLSALGRGVMPRKSLSGLSCNASRRLARLMSCAGAPCGDIQTRVEVRTPRRPSAAERTPAEAAAGGRRPAAATRTTSSWR